MIIGSKNKGDWSEFYALLYLLGEREIYAADEHLQRLTQLFFPIIRIIRQEEANRRIDFLLNGEMLVEVHVNSSLLKTMTSAEFKAEAERLLHDIPAAVGRQFTITHGEDFLNSIGCRKLAAPSTDVTDIRMEVHDTNTGTDQIMGFSIKSYLGGAPTLLNASGATNFVYEVEGITDEQMEVINAIDTRTKILDRIAKITDWGGSITYRKPANDVFAGNLQMIDSKMEFIIAEMLLYSYATNTTTCSSIIEHLENANPLSYPWEGFYTHKFKEFLCAKALGLDPSERWYGTDDTNGGYIVVKSDGDVVAYHIYNRDKFKQYLFDNTYLERSSTSRHGYASLYKENGKMYIKLNLQIRFKEQ